MRIATVIGARPQFIKSSILSSMFNKLDSIYDFTIHTGQHFENKMSNIFFKELGIPKPKYNLKINRMPYCQMIDKMEKNIKPILSHEKVDGLIVYGDTNTTLAGALAAQKLNVPIFHIEAGLRSFNRNMNEENNRLITDHLSTILFCPTENSIENLKKEKFQNEPSSVAMSCTMLF